MTTATNPIQWLETQTQARPLTVLVYFRGIWCPFCQGYLKEMNGEFLQKVRAAGGELIAVTSQSDDVAEQVHEQWKLDYPVRSEPANVLAQRYGVSITAKAETPLAEDPSAYPHGMAQPAVIALDGDGQVLFSWAIVPAEMNLGGASDRPLPLDIWKVIEAKLAGQQDADLQGEVKLDPDYLAKHYPEQHATFQAWVASMQAS